MTESRVRAVVLNSHGIGHFVYVKEFPKPGETIQAKRWEFSEDAAKGTDVVVALGKLGIRSAFVCRVGDDEPAKKGEEWMMEAGVDLTYYVKSPELQTKVGITILQDDGENIVIGSAKTDCPTTEQDARAAIDAFPEADYFITGLEIDTILPLKACRYAKSKGKITMLNSSPLLEPIGEKLNYVDYLFSNKIEGRNLAALPDDFSDYREIAMQIVKRYGVGIAVLTLGNEGCYLYGNGVDKYYPPFEMPSVSTVGAGDGFMAAYAAGLIWGMKDENAAVWANRYASVVVSRKGSIRSYPWLDEIKQYLSQLQLEK